MALQSLLTAAPLLSATSSLTFSLCEDTFIRPMLHTGPSEAAAKLRHHVNMMLPSHENWTRRGLVIVFTTYPLSIATAIMNFRRHDAQVDFSASSQTPPRLAAGFYLAGMLFSILHFPFGSKAMHHLYRVRDNKGASHDIESDNTANMVSWMNINLARSLVADLPSWICYFTAFWYAMSTQL